MTTPLDLLEQAVHASPTGKLSAFTLIDATMLNVTLGLFEKAGIPVAAFDVSDTGNPIPVRFDSSGQSGGIAKYWQCISAGKMYFYFDSYQMVALITKTVRTKLFFMTQVVYTPYFLTPVAPVLVGPQVSEFDIALDWVEKRYRKAMEIIPSLQPLEADR